MRGSIPRFRAYRASALLQVSMSEIIDGCMQAQHGAAVVFPRGAKTALSCLDLRRGVSLRMYAALSSEIRILARRVRAET